ncbi:hypothetical protein ACIRSU_31210 [Streptomyces sp. NPDC101160]|uniref:hypothetical protein n=1 Tax=Streptomyces sp. NPDC101160 TaxID=3366118 RepID=UPI00381A8038
MTKDQVGRLIGAGFGLFFVAANVGFLPTGVATPLRLAAIAAFLGVVVFGRRARPAPAPAAGPRFGRRYWYVVAAEVLALAAGLVVIARVLHAPQASVGWIAFVVGVHFFGLAVAWHRPSLHTLAAAITVCGATGLALAAADAPAQAIQVTAGVVPGLLLLGSVWWSARSRSGEAAAAVS